MKRLIPGLVFWGWNAIFILFSVSMLFTGIIPAMIEAATRGQIPMTFIASLFLVVFIPFAAVALAMRRRDHSGQFLLKLFFAVELPLFIAAMLRLFVLRQLTAGSALLLISVIGVSLYYLWTLYREPAPGKLSAALNAPPAAIAGAVGLGAAAFLALYAVPFGGAMAKGIWEAMPEFLSFAWVKDFFGGFVRHFLDALLALTAGSLLLSSALVFVVAPIFLAIFYGGAWRAMLAKAAPHIGRIAFIALSGLATAGWLTAYGSSAHHREAATIARLGALDTLAEARADIETNREEIRRDLVDGYLYRYRYLQTREKTAGVARLYEDVFGMPQSAAAPLEEFRRFMLTPLLYSGKADDDATAGQLYEQIFDTPIQRAESKRIKKALEATWNRDEAKAGLLDIDRKNVFVSEQTIKVEEFPAHAVVEIEETYENRTPVTQEVYYYFSLPEDAAITGLWLGLGPDRSKQDAFIVAPRGAAQKVYEGEVQQRIDPALLEQVGPTQYRLRAFPVPREERDSGADHEDQRLRMRFSYATPRVGKDIAAPVLLERRNAYWSSNTKRRLNGAPLAADDWMPPFFAADRAAATPAPIALLEGFVATPVNVPEDASPMRIAALVDTSWSMREHDGALKTELAALSDAPAIAGDIYYIGANGAENRVSAIANLKPVAAPWFGALTPQDMLTAFTSLAGDAAYDLIIVLTDQGSYKSDAAFDSARLDAPLWFVHLGLPAYAYDDGVLDLIYRTRGGVASSVAEALTGGRAARAGLRLSAGRAWRVDNLYTDDKAMPPAAPPATPALAAIAARQAALAMTAGAASDPILLDRIHKLAVAHGVVTPWSSMIVLVNDRQKEALEEASKGADRFARNAATGEETLTAPTVTGVPEPHEWVLMLIAAAALAMVWRRRKGRPSPAGRFS